MGDYYNKTRIPVGVTLRRGGSMSVGPKTWCYIPPEDEGTPGLAESLRKGFLVRSLIPITDLSPRASVTPVPVVAVNPSVTSVPELVASSVSAPGPASVTPAAPPAAEPKPFRRNK
jgi:hypothetical protein